MNSWISGGYLQVRWLSLCVVFRHEYHNFMSLPHVWTVNCLTSEIGVSEYRLFTGVNVEKLYSFKRCIGDNDHSKIANIKILLSITSHFERATVLLYDFLCKNPWLVARPAAGSQIQKMVFVTEQDETHVRSKQRVMNDNIAIFAVSERWSSLTYHLELTIFLSYILRLLGCMFHAKLIIL